MGQMRFFDLSRRYEGLDRNRNRLVTLARMVPWGTFRPQPAAALAERGACTAVTEGKSAGVATQLCPKWLGHMPKAAVASDWRDSGGRASEDTSIKRAFGNFRLPSLISRRRIIGSPASAL
jgi:hypothetical protein